MECSVTITHGFALFWLTNEKKCSIMQCFAIPFKPLGPKMGESVSYSNTTSRLLRGGCGRPSEREASHEALQNPIKVGCNTRLKGVGHLPRKTNLKLYFELGINRQSVVRDFYRLL